APRKLSTNGLVQRLDSAFHRIAEAQPRRFDVVRRIPEGTGLEPHRVTRPTELTLGYAVDISVGRAVHDPTVKDVGQVLQIGVAGDSRAGEYLLHLVPREEAPRGIMIE